MSCPAIITGDQFLVRTLAHIDCQARSLGTFGYESLAQPGSAASLTMTALLTLFVAVFGLRLLFGPGPGIKDTVYDVLKIGIVLTLAFSWPAFKTVIYDLAIETPGEVAAAISPPTISTGDQGLPARLQSADAAIVDLMESGTGRQTGALLEGGALGGNFADSTAKDGDAFGNARLLFLAGIIASLALLRLAAGLLLALTPLAAGLLLFQVTRGLFSGWIRGLVLTVLGTIGASIVLAVELAVIEPWLADALRVRSLGYATPAAPTELFAMTLAFALVLVGMVWLLGRVAFMRGWQDWQSISLTAAETDGEPASTSQSARIGGEVRTSRVERIADSISAQTRHEDAAETSRLRYSQISDGSDKRASGNASHSPIARLGSTYRRTAGRKSIASNKRDRTK